MQRALDELVMTQKGISEINGMEQYGNLRILRLSKNRITGCVIAVAHHISRSSSPDPDRLLIVRLVLVACSPCPDSAVVVSELKNLERNFRLEKLYLAHNQIRTLQNCWYQPVRSLTGAERADAACQR